MFFLSISFKVFGPPSVKPMTLDTFTRNDILKTPKINQNRSRILDLAICLGNPRGLSCLSLISIILSACFRVKIKFYMHNRLTYRALNKLQLTDAPMVFVAKTPQERICLIRCDSELTLAALRTGIFQPIILLLLTMVPKTFSILHKFFHIQCSICNT